MISCNTRWGGVLRLLSNSFNLVAIPGCEDSSSSHHQEYSMTKLFTRFLQDQTGATAIEYGLIAAGIALAIIAVVNGLGTNLNTKFTSINTSLK
jgi:pilus assembly protein Flp/PilA